MRAFCCFFFLFIGPFYGFSQTIVLKDVHLIPMNRAAASALSTLVIRDGRIDYIGKFRKRLARKGATVVEGRGRYVMPGLVDMHVHLPDSGRVDALLRRHVKAGVTRLRIMNTQTPQIVLRNRLAQQPGLVQPILYYSHIVRRETYFSEMQCDSLMRAIQQNGLSFIKLFSLSNEAMFDNLMRSANRYGITVCGHYPRYQQAGKTVTVPLEKVLSSQFRSIEHLAGYEGLADEAAMTQAVAMTKQYGTYHCPTLDWDVMAYDLQYPMAYKKRLTYALLPDKERTDWEATYAKQIEKAGGAEKVIAARDKYQPTFAYKTKLLKKLYDAGCPLLLGADAGNVFQGDGLNVYEEMKHWANCGIAPYDILRAATVVPAQFFKQAQDWGTLEVGKAGDVIVLGKNPLENIDHITTVEMTIVRGRVYTTATLTP